MLYIVLLLSVITVLGPAWFLANGQKGNWTTCLWSILALRVRIITGKPLSRSWEASRLTHRKMHWAPDARICILCCAFQRIQAQRRPSRRTFFVPGENNACLQFSGSGTVADCAAVEGKEQLTCTWNERQGQTVHVYSAQKVVWAKDKEGHRIHNTASWWSFPCIFFPSPSKLDSDGRGTLPTAYSYLPHFLASVDKELLTEICTALYLCPDEKCDSYETATPFLRPDHTCWNISRSPCKEGPCVVHSLNGVADILCTHVIRAGSNNKGNCWRRIKWWHKSTLQSF